MGPRTEPWGTPERTGSGPEHFAFSKTLCSAIQAVCDPLPGVVPDAIPVQFI